MAQFFTAPAEELEVDYTTWTHKWTNEVTDGLDSSSYFSPHIDDKDDILYLFWRDDLVPHTRYGVYNLADFSVVFESPNDSDYMGGYPNNANASFAFRGYSEIYGYPSLSLQTYLLLLRDGLEVFEVWRGATELWSRNITNERSGGSIVGGNISITGKWIIVLTWKLGEPEKLICYEGS